MLGSCYMSDDKKIEWNGLMLTPEVYEQVKDTFYVEGPTHWELQCFDEAVRTVLAYVDGINTIGIDQYYGPEMGSDAMKELVIRLFQEDIVLKAFAYDEVEIAQAVELLSGIREPKVERIVQKLLEEMIEEINQILQKTLH